MQPTISVIDLFSYQSLNYSHVFRLSRANGTEYLSCGVLLVFRKGYLDPGGEKGKWVRERGREGEMGEGKGKGEREGERREGGGGRERKKKEMGEIGCL